MLASTELLEREGELATIERALEAAAAGEGALLTIEGEAGSGKTSLLDAAARLGEGRGMTVLRARGGEFERDFAYGVVRQLFEPLLDEPGRREELLSGDAAPAAPVFEPAAAPVEGADPFGVQHGLHRLLARIAGESPALLLVDDAQWSDLASLRALAYIGRRLEHAPLTMTLAVRTGEAGGHEPLLDQLRREPVALAIEPRPLSTEASAELAAREVGRRPSAEFAAGCCEATAGNPFLLVELLRALGSGLAGDGEYGAERLAELAAAGASRSILARLARLGGRSTAVARAVAVLEPNAEARLVGALTGFSAEEVAAESERLVAARLLTDSRPVAFAHPLVREAVLSDVAQPRRAAEHARAARLLDGDGAPADTVAAQLLLAEPRGDEWAVEALRAAAAGALGRGAPDAAVAYLRRALREPPPKVERLEVSRELGVALLRTDDPEGIEVLRAVRGALSDPVLRAEVATQLSASLAIRRPGEEATMLLEESLAEIPDRKAGIGLRLRAYLLMQLASGAEKGVPPGALPTSEERPEVDTVEGRMLVNGTGFLLAIGLGSVEDGCEMAERVLADPGAVEASALAGVPPHFSVATLVLADRGELADQRFDAMIEASRRRGAVAGVIGAHCIRAHCRYWDGDLRGAREDADTALDLLRPYEFRVHLLNATSAMLKALVALGDVAAAQRLLDEPARGRDSIQGLPGAVFLVARGELRLATGRHAEARNDFLAVAERIPWVPYPTPEGLGWRTGLARAEAALGNEEEARRLAGEAVGLAREAGGDAGDRDRAAGPGRGHRGQRGDRAAARGD